jgi:hypothetical protein
MPRFALRLVVAIAAALCAWLVTAPAWAGMSAPQCDKRGAITFAPPPQLQPIEQSIDATDDDMSCVERMLAAEGLRQGNAPPPSPTAVDPVAAPPLPALPSFAPMALPPSLDIASHPPTGVRASLERPPRI